MPKYEPLTSNDSREIFRKIQEASATAGGNHIRAGDYVFEMQKMFVKRGFKGISAIHEFLVISATQTEDNAPNKVGSRCSTVQNFGKVMGAGNAKSLVCGVMGEPEGFFDGDKGLDELAKFYGEAQPARFLKVRCIANTNPEYKDPKFVFYKWEHIEPTDAELTAILARRNSTPPEKDADEPPAHTDADAPPAR